MRKTILITGASSGIGRAIVGKYLGTDDFLILQYKHNKPEFSLEEGKDIHWIQADFSSLKGIDLFLGKLSRKNLFPDVFIYCNGIVENKHFTEVSNSEFMEILSVNSLAFYKIANQFFLENQTDSKYKKIIAISSIGVKFAGSSTSLLYSASKAMLEAMAQSFAKHGAVKKILVNSIRAGVTDTNLLRYSKKDIEGRVQKIPLRRMARPEEIADMVAFLVSDKANYITGQVFSVSGGE